MIDPVLFEIGPLVIRWYSLAYIIGILAGSKYVQFIDNKYGEKFLNKSLVERLIIYAIIGIVIGGRLGYVFFYNLDYYLSEPIRVFQTWKGGMSFHGGLIGLIAALYIFARKEKIPFLKLTDLIATAAPIGIFLGRLANFINGELYGRPSNLPWAITLLPYETIKRHPTQLYEAFTEGIMIFAIINFSLIKVKLNKEVGKLSGLFLILYSVFRIIIENFREPDPSLGFFFSFITMGQILSLPMLIGGTFLYLKSPRVRSVY